MAGLLTLTAMLLALVLANSPLRDVYQVVHHLPVMVRVSVVIGSLLSAMAGIAAFRSTRPGRAEPNGN